LNWYQFDYIIMNSDDRPVKFNPTGQYDLNFIDWNNEWNVISNRYDFANPEMSINKLKVINK